MDEYEQYQLGCVVCLGQKRNLLYDTKYIVSRKRMDRRRLERMGANRKGTIEELLSGLSLKG